MILILSRRSVYTTNKIWFTIPIVLYRFISLFVDTTMLLIVAFDTVFILENKAYCPKIDMVFAYVDGFFFFVPFKNHSNHLTSILQLRRIGVKNPAGLGVECGGEISALAPQSFQQLEILSVRVLAHENDLPEARLPIEAQRRVVVDIHADGHFGKAHVRRLCDDVFR